MLLHRIDIVTILLSNNTAAVMVNDKVEHPEGNEAVESCVQTLIRLLARSIALKQAAALRKAGGS